jgi:hypothetical protein
MYTRRKQTQTKNTTPYLDTTICKQTQKTPYGRYYKQLEVKMNGTSFFYAHIVTDITTKDIWFTEYNPESFMT